MRKLLVILLLIIPACVWGWGSLVPCSRIGGQTSSSCDDCSGSLMFAWHMDDNDPTPDVTLGTPCGCSDGDEIGAETGSPEFSTTQKSDGTRSLRINALDEDYLFVVSSDDLINLDSFKVTFDIYVVSYPGTAAKYIEIFRATSGSDYVVVVAKNGGTLNTYHNGGATWNDLAGVTVATGSFVSCELQMKTGVAGNDSYLICGANSAEEDNDLGTAASATSLYFGDKSGDEAGEYYIDNVKIYPCDRY